MYVRRNSLGYKIKDSGTLETNIKGGFGVQSDWPQLFNLLMKINAELNWRKIQKTYTAQAMHS